MKIIFALMRLKICAVVLIFLCATPSIAQTEIVFAYKEKIKSQNGFKGIKRGDTWVVQPIYNEIVGVNNHILCSKDGLTDIYRNNYSFTSFLKGVKPEHLDYYKSYVISLTWCDTYCIPYFENGKWGFYEEESNTGAQFDSLFILPLKNIAGKCGSMMGIYMNGKRGVADTKGKIVVKPQDYTDISYKYIDRPDLVLSDRFQIICTYNNSDTANFIWLKENEFIETKGATGLKGYVFKGDIVEAKYTSVSAVYIPDLADFKCVLPGGEVEYRKGTELVADERMAAYEEKMANEEKLQQERQKAKELAAQSGLTAEIITLNHSLMVYPSWASVFGANTTSKQYLTSSALGLKSSELFAEAPNTWFKNDPIRDKFYGTIRLSFDDSETETTIAERKTQFLNYCARYADLPVDKLAYIEEQVLLADGTKGTLLFFYTDRTQNVGYQLNCEIFSVSKKNPKYVTNYRLYMEGESGQTLAEKDFSGWKDYFKAILLTVKANN